MRMKDPDHGLKDSWRVLLSIEAPEGNIPSELCRDFL